MVQWNIYFSNYLEIKSGIRLGGIKWPGYYTICINDA